jgi:hypothetical protein
MLIRGSKSATANNPTHALRVSPWSLYLGTSDTQRASHTLCGTGHRELSEIAVHEVRLAHAADQYSGVDSGHRAIRIG